MKFTATIRNHPTKSDHAVIDVEGTLSAAKSAAHDAFKKDFPYAEIVVHQVLSAGEPVLVARRRVCGTSWIHVANVTYEEPPKLRHLDDAFVQMSLFGGVGSKDVRNPDSPYLAASADLKLRQEIGRDYAAAARRRHV